MASNWCFCASLQNCNLALTQWYKLYCGVLTDAIWSVQHDADGYRYGCSHIIILIQIRHIWSVPHDHIDFRLYWRSRYIYLDLLHCSRPEAQTSTNGHSISKSSGLGIYLYKPRQLSTYHPEVGVSKINPALQLSPFHGLYFECGG